MGGSCRRRDHGMGTRSRCAALVVMTAAASMAWSQTPADLLADAYEATRAVAAPDWAPGRDDPRQHNEVSKEANRGPWKVSARFVWHASRQRWSQTAYAASAPGATADIAEPAADAARACPEPPARPIDRNAPRNPGSPGASMKHTFTVGAWRYTTSYTYAPDEGDTGWRLVSLEALCTAGADLPAPSAS